jgi:lipopolysaccharide/colanic/teichoic acid biosynthesis glycosyltransferase
VKRVVDLVVSIMLLAAALPLIVGLAIAIKLVMPGPVFYGGMRVGRGGRRFRMWKFRSMVVDADRIGASSTTDDDPRMTPLGRWMRRYKVDELPQFWNVLVGDMSLVGPRPQVAWAVERYTRQERILLTVRPGITDPASLRFANEGEILRGHPDPDRAYFELIHPEKMRLSIHYVTNQSVRGDLKILVATAGAALGRRRGRVRVPEQASSTSTS